MQITTSLLPHANQVTEQTDVAVVIDVLRATTVMTTALAAGASRIVTCREIPEALELAEGMVSRPMLCGERNCKPIVGFDLGNSPGEYTPKRVGSRTLILTTTNGTRAIEAAANARRLIAACFLNLSAVIDTLQDGENVHLACAGTDGKVTAEDVLLAGAILIGCETRYQAVVLDDESILARQLWRSWFETEASSTKTPTRRQLSARLRETRGGRNLLRAGYERDLDRCADIDAFRVVAELQTRQPMAFS